MNENENFESLRRLLALKRHEVPPPGYFDRFSDGVIARIRDGESETETSAGKMFTHAPWLLKFLQIFESKPVFAGSFASALCLLLLLGIVYAERSDEMPQSMILQSAQLTSQPLASNNDGTQATANPAEASGQNIFATSISNSSPSSLQPLFGQGQGGFAQPVSYSVPGN